MTALAFALARLTAPVEVFFRNDDAGWAQDRLSALVAVFADRDLPIDCAVIPAALDEATAHELCALRAAYPLLGLHQHGFAHANHEPAGSRKCEFGLSRPPDRQLADIIAGRERLDGLLGRWDRIFTPPWNRCSAAALGQLRAHGFALLSTDRLSDEVDLIAQLPVTLDWQRAQREGRLDTALAAAFTNTDAPVGIMLHHGEMDAGARDELACALDLIAATPLVRAQPMRRWIGES